MLGAHFVLFILPLMIIGTSFLIFFLSRKKKEKK